MTNTDDRHAVRLALLCLLGLGVGQLVTGALSDGYADRHVPECRE